MWEKKRVRRRVNSAGLEWSEWALWGKQVLEWQLRLGWRLGEFQRGRLPPEGEVSVLGLGQEKEWRGANRTFPCASQQKNLLFFFFLSSSPDSNSQSTEGMQWKISLSVTLSHPALLFRGNQYYQFLGIHPKLLCAFNICLYKCSNLCTQVVPLISLIFPHRMFIYCLSPPVVHLNQDLPEGPGTT